MTGKGRSPRSHRTPGPAPHWPPVLCSIQHISGRDEGRLSMTQRRQAPPGTDTPTLPQSARHPNPSTNCPTPQPLHNLADTPTWPTPQPLHNLLDTPTPPKPAYWSVGSTGHGLWQRRPECNTSRSTRRVCSAYKGGGLTWRPLVSHV